MAATGAHESLPPLSIPHTKFRNFNICRLMAEKAMHDQDYRAQLERSAYSHDKPSELSKLNAEIEKSMAALRQKHINDEEKAWKRSHRRAFKVEEGHNIVAARQVTTMHGDGGMAWRHEMNIGHVSWAKEGDWIFAGTASSSARRALAMLAANQRTQAYSHPFQLMKLPAELREQVYREGLIGGGRTIVVSADKVLSTWSRSCKIQGPSPHGKDITTALLRTNRGIYEEALPVLYHSHAFDFGIDVHNIALFFDQTSLAARQSVHCIHMELLRYGIDRPLRSVPGRDVTDNCVDWSRACAYIARHLRVKEVSFNINFSIHQDFQRFLWVKGLAQIRGVRAVFHHDSPNKNGLKSNEASVLLANQMTRHNWGTDAYRWKTLLEYLSSEMAD